MSRNHRKPGVIRVICTDAFHHGEPGYAELGYYHLGTLRLAQRKGFADAGFRWHGPREAVERLETRDQAVSMSARGAPLTRLPLPVKLWRTEDDKFVWRFRCTCGRDPQRSDADLAAIVTRYQITPLAARAKSLDPLVPDGDRLRPP